MQGSARSELPTARQHAQLAVSQRRSAGRFGKPPARAFLPENAAIERISDAPGGGGADRDAVRGRRDPSGHGCRLIPQAGLFFRDRRFWRGVLVIWSALGL